MSTSSRSSALALLALVGIGVMAPASAQADDKDSVYGTYQVKYEQVASNCTTTGMSMSSGTLEIKKGKVGLIVDIERIPLMTGKAGKTGRVSAASKVGPTSIQGLDGKFSVAGKVDDGMLQLVFVAEYYLNRRALCTQSWKIAGMNTADL